MNCPNCGKKISDKSSFCTSCGQSIDSESVSSTKPEESKKNANKKAIGVAIGCFVAVVAIIAVVIIAIVAFVFNVIKGVSEMEEYDMGFSKVPSIYKLMGKEDVCSFSSSINSGNKEYEIEYCNTSDKVINEYIDKLKKEYGFKEIEDTTFNREVTLDDKTGSLKVIHVIVSGDTITYRVG